MAQESPIQRIVNGDGGGLWRNTRPQLCGRMPGQRTPAGGGRPREECVRGQVLPGYIICRRLDVTGECSPVGGCNETRMLELLPWCGEAFANMMHKVEVWKRCNLSEFIMYYESFTNCTESKARVVGCYWPNHLAQGFVTDVHRWFFHNCTVDRPHWEDPPDEILIPLIVVPILLTLAMTGLVVWHSKRTDRLL
ncbi:receptor activity-modifying protein 3 isoform X1 [Vicugna pacos]|uniref:Receptor activity-modifying protein 3 n=1 Tax=Vicugna pacos TaxID=30538 RepID=A0ABM5DKX2_VICPA